jgi:diguanylate cyclase (GGDEF)-like protein/PAS domain S-box-containing protein
MARQSSSSGEAAPARARRRGATIAAALVDREAPLRVIFENIQDVVYLLDIEQDGGYRFVAVNPPFLAATGLTEEQVIGRRVEDVIPEPSLRLVLARYAHAIQSGRAVFWEETSQYPAGTRYGEVMVAPVKDGDGRAVQLVGTVHDVTEHRASQERLHRLAHFDALTDLPNRHHLHDCLARETAAAEAHGKSLAVLYLDLDGFKEVNDTYGHQRGDELLHQVADRLLESTRARDVVGRYGGDEFGVVAPLGTNPDDAAALARNIIEAIQRPFQVDGQELRVTTSIGIAICPQDSCEPEALIRSADTAMYYAKAAGRNGYRFYTAEMNAWLRERRELEAALRKAVERNEFSLEYQPKVDLKTGQWKGAEALLRWKRPGHGWVYPGAFVPVLEDTGLIVPLGRWALEEACRQIATWRWQGLEDLHVSVNVSGRQILTDERRDDPEDPGYGLDRRAGFCDFVEEAMAMHSVGAGQLELEIAESTLMQDAEKASALLECLDALGVKIHVDDFGTGYSSLAYLKRFPISTLKIDREFVRGLPDDQEDRAITRAIITLAHTLGLHVVAEGVERIEQVAFLADEGCDEAQGFYFARPLSEDQFSRGHAANSDHVARGSSYRGSPR